MGIQSTVRKLWVACKRFIELYRAISARLYLDIDSRIRISFEDGTVDLMN